MRPSEFSHLACFWTEALNAAMSHRSCCWWSVVSGWRFDRIDYRHKVVHVESRCCLTGRIGTPENAASYGLHDSSWARDSVTTTVCISIQPIEFVFNAVLTAISSPTFSTQLPTGMIAISMQYLLLGVPLLIPAVLWTTLLWRAGTSMLIAYAVGACGAFFLAWAPGWTTDKTQNI